MASRHGLASPIARSVAVVALASVAACVSAGPRERVVATAPLRTADPVEVRFTARDTGPHQITLQFDTPIADAANGFITAAAMTSEALAPTFDFSWTLSSRGQQLTERRRPQRATGYIEQRRDGFGTGPVQRRGLGFGSVDLVSGTEYTLRIESGPDFDVLLSASPELEVFYQPYTILLAPR